MQEDKRFAVLIDADNVSEKYIKYILDEVTNDGIITYKRIYGDWTKPNLSTWKNSLLSHSITPIQQYSHVSGKNATDSALIIDAMDILYTKNVEGFCIVSSDSDFTRLASRLRESGMKVVGMGEKKTPSSFINACNRFKYLEIIEGNKDAKHIENSLVNTDKLKSNPAVPESITPLQTVQSEIKSIVDQLSDDDGWASLSDIGNILSKRLPDFDVRNYGYKKLANFIISLRTFETKSVKKNNINIYYVKKK